MPDFFYGNFVFLRSDSKVEAEAREELETGLGNPLYSIFILCFNEWYLRTESSLFLFRIREVP